MAFIVTGASSGIGFAVASALASRQYEVIAVARNADRLEMLMSSCGDCLQIVPADLSSDSGRHAVIEKAKSIGKVEGIVHAAGSLVAPAHYQNLDTEHLLADLNIHVTAPIVLNNALEEELAGGRIVYIDSYSANNLRVGWSGYSIVKAAAQMAARAACEEISNASVIRVFPGAVRTPLVESVLLSEQSSPTIDLFRGLALNGAISEPDVIGEFITDVLVTATVQQLEERELWDFGNQDDHVF